MATTHRSRSADIRGRLRHPVIDADGHFTEQLPVVNEYFLEYAQRAGGSRMADKFRAARGLIYSDRVSRWSQMTPEQRKDGWVTRPAWGLPFEKTIDRATGFLPRLLYERLDDLGIDFAVLYPSQTTNMPEVQDEELRRVGCRAMNTLVAEVYREFSDRMTPVALIPMHTPQEAIDELEHVVKVLGLKAVAMTGHLRRPIPAVQREHPELAPFAERLDLFALDSDYDYDPVWARCLELGVSLAAHSTEQAWGSRRSISNYMYNHIGAFGAAGETLCKALFLGGVTVRYPKLNFAFLEGGIGWACALYADLVGHWEKRNARVIQHLAKLDPGIAELEKLVDRYAYPRLKAKSREVLANLRGGELPPKYADEWALCPLDSAEELRDAFAPRFFFGCEADDPLIPWAFNTKTNPKGARLGAMMGSDIGHWDVPDMTEVVSEAYEMVEKHLITEEDFQDFVFGNPVRFYTSTNPGFFKGTRCEAQVQRFLTAEPPEGR